MHSFLLNAIRVLGEKVLEIGTGSGYQSAVLACCGASVYTVERIRNLYDSVTKRFAELNVKVMCKYGDGHEGWAEMAPFDKIIVTAGADGVPHNLLAQCKIGGSIVIPMQEKNGLRMIRLTRVSENNFNKEDFGNCAFVPMLKGII